MFNQFFGSNGVGSAQSVDLTQGQVSHYLLNNNADDSFGIYDGISLGVQNGSVDFQGDMGKFDGYDDFIKVATMLESDVSRQYTQATISCFVKVDTINNGNADVIYNHFSQKSFDGYDGNGGFMLYIDTNGNVIFEYVLRDKEPTTDSNGNYLNQYYVQAKSSFTLTTDTLYHIVGVLDNNNAKLYINGILDCEVSSTASIRYSTVNTDRPAITIGARYFEHVTTAYDFLDGSLSNVKIFNEVKDQAFIDALYAEGYYPKPLPLPTTDGIIAHYPLTGTAEDTTGSYDGTENGGLTYVDDAEFGSVASFDGVDDYVSSDASIYDLSIASNRLRTFTSWVNKKGNGTDLGIIFSNTFNGNMSFRIDNTSTKIKAVVRQADSTYIVLDGITNLSNNVWHHIAVIFNYINGRIAIYLNGILESEIFTWDGTILNNTFSQLASIGSQANSHYGNYDIRNFQCHNKELTQQEITDIYNYEKNFRPIDIDDGLVAYYPLVENSLDNYKNQYDGTDTDMTYDGLSGVFNGSTSSIDASLPAINNRNLSIGAWVNLTYSATVGNSILTFNSTSIEAGFLVNTSKLLTYQFINSSGVWVKIQYDFSPYYDTWTHVFVSVTPTVLELYINGQVIATMSNSDSDRANETTSLIGSMLASATKVAFLEGNMSYLRYYNKTKISEQIKAIYNTEKGDFGL